MQGHCLALFHELAGADGFAISSANYVAWFCSWVFAVASSTIPSGSMSERTCLEGYIILSAFVHSWIYPVFYHWVFAGWLSKSFGGSAYVGFMDFSGSAYVHTLGGTVALTGSIFLGARLGRFNADGQPVYRGFKPYSYSLIGLGCLLLWTGWYAFNALGLTTATHLSADQIAVATARSSVVTTLGGASGILGACLYSRVKRKSYDFDSVINGALAGLVAVTAGSVIMRPYAGIVLGFIGGITYSTLLLHTFAAHGVYLTCLRLRYELAAGFLERRGIDDPVNASPVHLFGGLVGTFAQLMPRARETIVVGDCNARLQEPSASDSLRSPTLFLRCTRRYGALLALRLHTPLHHEPSSPAVNPLTTHSSPASHRRAEVFCTAASATDADTSLLSR